MDFNAPVSTWMTSLPQRPAVILSYHLSPPESSQVISKGL